jgi:hypothetical protein
MAQIHQNALIIESNKAELEQQRRIIQDLYIQKALLEEQVKQIAQQKKELATNAELIARLQHELGIVAEVSGVACQTDIVDVDDQSCQTDTPAPSMVIKKKVVKAKPVATEDDPEEIKPTKKRSGSTVGKPVPDKELEEDLKSLDDVDFTQ